ncbi:MAG: IS110 family transposase [Actinobacteria bacterium]|nr:IS110 family transposase [Actinomycetota bacterium]MCL5882922.1 IS110 family transposase [Actinomycetota bacterium]
MEVTTVGLDLAKNIFQLHAVDRRGKTILKKRLTRNKVLPFFTNMAPCLIGMEATGSAHHWARELGKLGHEIKLIGPQFVKPYRKGSKNDQNDAAAICEAVGRPDMHFVPAKTKEQQDIQAVHRIRQRLVADRTSKANQTRGLLSEYGIIIPQGIRRLRKQLPFILEDADNGLSPLARELFGDLYRQLLELDEKISSYDRKIGQIFKSSPVCQRLAQVEGVGPMIATAMVAAVGDGRNFKNGRQMAAWLGLVPGQNSSGDKRRLLSITKRGDCYLRTLLVHGARSVARRSDGKNDSRSLWLNRIKDRRNINIAAVALANKNARILWALLVSGEEYRACA